MIFSFQYFFYIADYYTLKNEKYLKNENEI